MLDKKKIVIHDCLNQIKKYMKEKIQLNLFYYYIQRQRNDQPYKMCTIFAHKWFSKGKR